MKWKGYDSSQSTWIDAIDFDCPEEIERLERLCRKGKGIKHSDGLLLNKSAEVISSLNSSSSSVSGSEEPVALISGIQRKRSSSEIADLFGGDHVERMPKRRKIGNLIYEAYDPVSLATSTNNYYYYLIVYQ